jgi:hypothetical protein
MELSAWSHAWSGEGRARSDHDLPSFPDRSRRTHSFEPHFVVVRAQPSPEDTNDTDSGDVWDEVAAPVAGTEK